MARFRIKPGSLSKVQANWKSANAKIQRKAVFALAIWADDLKGDIQREYIRIKAFDTGDLHGSVARDGPMLIGSKKVRVVVFTNKEYASIIELGRRARSGRPPPVIALVGWAKRKGLVTHLPANISFGGKWGKHWAASKRIWENSRKKGGGKKRGKRTRQELDPIVREMILIRAISDAIYRRGIKGRKPITKVFRAKSKTFKRDIARMVQSMP